MIERVAGAVDRYWMAPSPAARLGAVRLGVGLFACVYVIGRLPHTLSYAGFDPRHFAPVGVVGWLCDAPLPPPVVWALAIGCAAASIPFALGWKTRVVALVFAGLLLWVLSYNNSWGMIFHTENLLVLQVLILAFSASGDGWSLDARGRAAPDDHGRYRWPLVLMCWVVVIAYVLAGVAKLRNAELAWGSGFLWGDDLRNYVAVDNARKALLGDGYSPIAAPLLHFDAAYRAMALATLAVELGAPLALLHRRLALAWVLAVWGFHASVVALMWIVFIYPLSGVAFLCFFRSERLAAWAARRWARARSFRARRARGTPAAP